MGTSKTSLATLIVTLVLCAVCAVAAARYGALADGHMDAGFPSAFVEAGQEWVPASAGEFFDFPLGRGAFAFGVLGAVVPLMALGMAARPRNLRPGAEHGSSRWLSVKEAAAFGDRKDPYNNIILSKHGRMRLNVTKFDLEHDRNKNVLIIGGPGSGKTRYIIKPCLLQLNASYVVTDPKGTLVVEVGGALAEAGYEVKVLDSADFSRSMHFNPFKYIECAEDIQPLVDCILTNTKPEEGGSNKQDPFWDSMAKLLMVAMTSYMFEALPPEKRTMRTLMKLISLVEAREGDDEYKCPADRIMEAWEIGERPDLKGMDVRQARAIDSLAPAGGWGRPHESSYACRNYSQFRVSAGKTMKSILSTVNSSLWMFGLESLLDLTDYDELDLDSLGGYKDDDLERVAATDPGVLEPGMGTPCGRTKNHPAGQRKTVLFLVMDDAVPTFRFLMATALYLTMTRLKAYADHCPKGSLPIPVMFYLDEFANIGRVANFENFITTIRSRNMAVVPVIQEGAQLEKFYSKEAARIIKGGCATWVYLGGCELETCKEISEIVGDETVDSDNRSKTYSQNNSSGISQQRSGRKLIDPSEVMRISMRKCLVLIKGAYPLLDVKYDLTKHPNYKFMKEHEGFDALRDRNARNYDASGLASARPLPQADFDAIALLMFDPTGSSSVEEALDASMAKLAEHISKS